MNPIEDASDDSQEWQGHEDNYDDNFDDIDDDDGIDDDYDDREEQPQAEDPAEEHRGCSSSSSIQKGPCGFKSGAATSQRHHRDNDDGDDDDEEEDRAVVPASAAAPPAAATTTRPNQHRRSEIAEPSVVAHTTTIAATTSAAAAMMGKSRSYHDSRSTATEETAFNEPLSGRSSQRNTIASHKRDENSRSSSSSIMSGLGSAKIAYEGPRSQSSPAAASLWGSSFVAPPAEAAPAAAAAATAGERGRLLLGHANMSCSFSDEDEDEVVERQGMRSSSFSRPASLKTTGLPSSGGEEEDMGGEKEQTRGIRTTKTGSSKFSSLPHATPVPPPSPHVMLDHVRTKPRRSARVAKTMDVGGMFATTETAMPADEADSSSGPDVVKKKAQRRKRRKRSEDGRDRDHAGRKAQAARRGRKRSHATIDEEEESDGSNRRSGAEGEERNARRRNRAAVDSNACGRMQRTPESTSDEEEEDTARRPSFEAREEDENLITDLLLEMDNALKAMRKKSALEKVMFLNKKYVQDRSFRLLFLRSNQYDCVRAAQALVSHFEKKLQIFDLDTVARDIRWDDLDRMEQHAYRTGSFILSSSLSDAQGRPIMFASSSCGGDPNASQASSARSTSSSSEVLVGSFGTMIGSTSGSRQSRARRKKSLHNKHLKVLWYWTMRCVQSSMAAQLHGIISVYWDHRDYHSGSLAEALPEAHDPSVRGGAGRGAVASSIEEDEGNVGEHVTGSNVSAYSSGGVEGGDSRSIHFEEWYRMQAELQEVLPIRIVAQHVCAVNQSEDSGTSSAFLAATAAAGTGVELQTHFGTDPECRAALLAHGVPESAIPYDTDHGNLVNQTFENIHELEMAAERDLIEQYEREHGTAVPYPTSYDVVLGRGNPSQSWPGNLKLAEMIRDQEGRHKRAPDRIAKTAITVAIMAAVQTVGGRFLKRAEDGAWHEVDQDVAREKIAMSFRNSKRLARNDAARSSHDDKEG